jgi:DNA polymerase epsilon subunit 4
MCRFLVSIYILYPCLCPNLLTVFAVARVQKIINADPERLNVSKNAAFAIALATEMFIQHLATTTHNVVKAERKPRRNIQYRDVSSAISKTDNLEFAVDVVPKTTTYKEFKKKQEDKERVSGSKDKGKEKAVNGTGQKGQTTLDGKLVDELKDAAEEVPNGETNNAIEDEASQGGSTEPALTPQAEEIPDAMEVDNEQERVEDSEPEEDPAAMQLEMEMRGPPRPPTTTVSPEARRSTGFTAINGSK